MGYLQLRHIPPSVVRNKHGKPGDTNLSFAEQASKCAFPITYSARHGCDQGTMEGNKPYLHSFCAFLFFLSHAVASCAVCMLSGRSPHARALNPSGRRAARAHIWCEALPYRKDFSFHLFTVALGLTSADRFRNGGGDTFLLTCSFPRFTFTRKKEKKKKADRDSAQFLRFLSFFYFSRERKRE